MLFLFYEKHSDEAYRAIVGAVLIKLGTGLITIWGNSNIYYLSYLLMKGQTVTANLNSIILLSCIVPIGLVTLLATKISNAVGALRIIRICAGIFFISPLFINLTSDMRLLCLFVLVLPGCCFSLSAIPLLKIVYGHFQQHKSKITSLLVFCFSLSGILWNYLFSMLVNPHNLKADIEIEKRLFFGKDVAERVVLSTNTLAFLTGACFIIGSIILTEKKNQKLLPPQSPPIDVQQREVFTTETDILEQDNRSLFSLIFNRNFILIYVISFINSLLPTYLLTNFKIIFLPLINDDHFLTYLLVGFSIISMSATFFWGHYADKHGIGQTILLVGLLDGIVKLLIFLAHGKILMAIFFILLGIFQKAMITVISPGLVELFGMRGGIELLPIKASSVMFTFGIVPLVQILTKNIYTPFELIHVFALMNLIAVVLSIIFWSVNRNKTVDNKMVQLNQIKY